MHQEHPVGDFHISPSISSYLLGIAFNFFRLSINDSTYYFLNHPESKSTCLRRIKLPLHATQH